jgi:hypothetical protein
MNFDELETPAGHLDGTSRNDLLDSYRKALAAIDVARDTLAVCTPSARDYHVKPDADAALRRAQNQHSWRVNTLSRLYDELIVLADAVAPT